ncbi:MAG: hypothetical protein WDM96_18755 [Lacunisphaera sp.]
MTSLLKQNSVTELLACCEEAERTQTTADAARSMNGTYVNTKFTRWLLVLDPFSEGYNELCLALYRELSGITVYDPQVNERNPSLDIPRAVSPPVPINTTTA